MKLDGGPLLHRAAAMRTAFTTNAVAGVWPIAALDGTRYDTGHPAPYTPTRMYAAVSVDRI